MKRYAFYFACSIALHLALLLLFLLVSVPERTKHQVAEPEIINATVLDEDKIAEEVKKIQQKKHARQQQLQAEQQKQQRLLEQARRKRLQEEKKIQALAKKRQQQAEALAKKQAELKRQAEAEATRLAQLKKQQAEAEKKLAEQRKKQQQARREAEKKRKAAEKARREAEKKRQAEIAHEKAKQARQAELARQKAARERAEAEARAKATAAAARQMTLRASRAIQQKVNNSWIRPMTSRKGLQSTVRVKLLPSGDVMSVQVVKSSGDAVFDRSAENAVRKASPLPVPKDRAVFNQNFRTFTFVFKPE